MADSWHEEFRKEVQRVLALIHRDLDLDRPSRPTNDQWATQSDLSRSQYRFDNQPEAADLSGDQLRPMLDQMDEKLSAIHDHTGEIKEHTSLLVDRIPHDFKPMIAEIKELLLGRLRSTYEATQGDQVADQPAYRSEQDFQRAFELLTPRERHLITELHEHGFLSYRELAEEVGLNPTTVKNMINRMAKHPRKVSFIEKSRHPVHGTQVGISEELRDAILQGKPHVKKRQ